MRAHRALGLDTHVARINCVIEGERDWPSPTALARMTRFVAYPIKIFLSNVKARTRIFGQYVERQDHRLHLLEHTEDKLGDQMPKVTEIPDLDSDDIEQGRQKDMSALMATSWKDVENAREMYRQLLLKALGSVALADKVLQTANSLNTVM